MFIGLLVVFFIQYDQGILSFIFVYWEEMLFWNYYVIIEIEFELYYKEVWRKVCRNI